MNAAPDQLQSFVRRIEALEDEITALNRDKSDVYKDAKGEGFDTKVLRKVIAARRLDASERNEQDAMFDLYWDAIHGVASARVEIIEEFDPATGEVIEAPTPLPEAPVNPVAHVENASGAKTSKQEPSEPEGSGGMQDRCESIPPTQFEHTTAPGEPASAGTAVDATPSPRSLSREAA